jgi:tetratricopeptide (TPR) repeat protein
MLALQQQDNGSALIHADQASICARIAEDGDLQVASLIRKALVYRYLKRPLQMLEAYQEAAQYSNHVSPLLRGRLFTGLAEAYSKLKQEYEAQQALESAYKVFPAHPKNDPNFSYTYFKLPQGFEVVMYLNLEQPIKAWEALAHVEKSVPLAIIPDRVELSIDQAKASLLSGNMDQTATYLNFAVTSSKALGSSLRYHEAYGIYQQMLVRWSQERQVQEMVELFH